MQRRHFDVLVSVGAAAIAVVLVVLGVYMHDRYDFAHNNVHEQLVAQKVFFPAKGELTPEERKQPRVVEFAGQAVDNGEKAQVYADDFIALHLKAIGGGKTYSELGGPQFALQDKVDAAKKSNDPALADLQGQLDELKATRNTLFTGETLRGLLLTTYGFGQFGEEAQLAMWVSWAAALVLLVLVGLGLVHAFRTRADETI